MIGIDTDNTEDVSIDITDKLGTMYICSKTLRSLTYLIQMEISQEFFVLFYYLVVRISCIL